ncbi:uncharacterized protein CPUR_04825 [Claviceps purpurea 20.1]|uniref:PHD and RING finger domain protein n=1 Tax=Claviceps purpurea (strain 20.1) TaxID=1111077 RepID=M1WFJ4_CLAP2|nr:uncharacterized protein CPUR_04825 [Claviceps purpurea 20.1]
MNEPEQCIICLEPLPRASTSTSPLLSPALSSAVNAAHNEATAATTTTDTTDTTDTTHLTASAAAPDSTSAVPAAAAAPEPNHLDIVASLDGCEHVIHDACIRSWAQKTNTCPICRTPFHFVRVYNGVDGTAISTYDVKDRKQVAEFDVQTWLGDNLAEEEEEQGNPCPICNSAEREDILLLCDSCDAAYHTHCIGLDYVPEGDWYCMECAHLFQLTDDHPGRSDQNDAEPASPRPQVALRPTPRDVRGYHVRTRQRLRRARRQARNAEWQGAWGQFSGRFYEMSDLDLDNHDDEDDDLEQFRRFQQLDRRELQRWQQRMDIANRLGARDTFASTIPPQISERLRPPQSPIQETRDERRAWGAFDRARDAESSATSARKRKSRSTTASPAEPLQEPERKLKRPRTRRLPTQAEASASAPTLTSGPSALSGPSSSGVRPTSNATSSLRHGVTRLETSTPLVSSLLKELEPLEPNPFSEDETPAMTPTWRIPPEASSPALSPSPSYQGTPRALSLTPPPLHSLGNRPTSPTLSLSTHIEPRYPPANYSPTRPNSDHAEVEPRVVHVESRPLELRQARPRSRRCSPQLPSATETTAPARSTMTQDDKKSINEIVKTALQPHWRARKLTTDQYATINRDISRKLYDEVKDAASLDEEARRTWEARATQEVAQALAALPT